MNSAILATSTAIRVQTAVDTICLAARSVRTPALFFSSADSVRASYPTTSDYTKHRLPQLCEPFWTVSALPQKSSMRYGSTNTTEVNSPQAQLLDCILLWTLSVAQQTLFPLSPRFFLAQTMSAQVIPQPRTIMTDRRHCPRSSFKQCTICFARTMACNLLSTLLICMLLLYLPSIALSESKTRFHPSIDGLMLNMKMYKVAGSIPQ